jgi:hypothetical protein
VEAHAVREWEEANQWTLSPLHVWLPIDACDNEVYPGPFPARALRVRSHSLLPDAAESRDLERISHTWLASPSSKVELTTTKAPSAVTASLSMNRPWRRR